MSNSRPSRTLTLKRPSTDPTTKHDRERKRSGARARRYAQQRLEDEQHARHHSPDTKHGPKSKPGPSRKKVAAAETFKVFAPCPVGLEQALADECHALGFDSASVARAGCHLQTDWTGVLRLNLHSRLATRVLVEVAHAPVEKEDDILELARATPWERWFGPQDRLRVDTSAIRSPMHSLQYCNLRAKDGICDRLREVEGARPNIDTIRPDARVHLFLDERHATLYLDSSGESLFKRGWRLDKGEAPLRENLTAGLLALSGWEPEQALVDPFCGSGTILIEAAWKALRVAPGIMRPFGFERLRTHNGRHWQDLLEEARSQILEHTETVLIGADTDPAALAAAQANTHNARLSSNIIRFESTDARLLPAAGPSGWIVTNPPYGQRLERAHEEFWAQWASQLKQHYSGWHVHVISSDHELPAALRLKPARRTPVYNGALDCRFFKFEMVANQYRRS